MLIHIVQHLHVFYLFFRVALGLIEAKRIKLEYMSSCLCLGSQLGIIFSPLPIPRKHLAMSRDTFWLSQLGRGTIHI